MGNVIAFRTKQDEKVTNTSTPEVMTLAGNGGFTDEVKQDINVLCNALGFDNPEQAIRVARDFYRKYPALMEWVSSPDVAVYKGDDIVGLLLNYKL